MKYQCILLHGCDSLIACVTTGYAQYKQVIYIKYVMIYSWHILDVSCLDYVVSTHVLAYLYDSYFQILDFQVFAV